MHTCIETTETSVLHTKKEISRRVLAPEGKLMTKKMQIYVPREERNRRTMSYIIRRGLKP